MAENEAIEELREQVETAEFMISFNMDFELKHDNSVLENKIKTAKIAISALEEIQQYRAIGTVEEIKDILQIISDGQDDVDESGISTGLLHTLLEYAEYKKIGTVEECREARERQRGKKPVYPYLKSFPTCPNCGEVNLQQENEYGNVVANYDFCPDCGQAISRESDTL